ncbi:hypothetical protein LG314_07905 [Agrococcus terreus]|uniref:hypothetical protein n=1 Tax=Agrococcus terreus TaxID=574649 RepID=UPI00384B9E42
MGYIHPDSGTYFHEETDPIAESTIADVLNEAQEAEHQAQLADRTRLDSLEASAQRIMPQVAPQNGYAVASGSNVAMVGSTVLLSLVLNRPDGITSAVVGTLPVGTRPASTITIAAMASMGGAATVCTVTINASGDIRCWTASATNTRLDIATLWQATA